MQSRQESESIDGLGQTSHRSDVRSVRFRCSTVDLRGSTISYITKKADENVRERTSL